MDVRAGMDEDEALVRRLYPMLRRFAAVVAPPEVAPDDLVQDALVATLRRGSLSGLADPGAYLRRALVNLASNRRRSMGRGRRAMGRLTAGVAHDATDSYPSDLAYLAELSPLARAVLYLHHVDGLRMEEVATVLGMRASSVRQLATRARRQLKARVVEGESC